MSWPGFERRAWPLWLFLGILFVEVSHVVCGSPSFSVLRILPLQELHHDMFIHSAVDGRLGGIASYTLN